MEQKTYDALLSYLNKGVYHCIISPKYELDIQEIEKKFPKSEINWLIDLHLEYLLHHYDESINKNVNPRSNLNNRDYLVGLTTDECNELLKIFKESMFSAHENNYKNSRKSLIKNCCLLSFVVIIICILIYCAIIYQDEVKAISNLVLFLIGGIIYCGIMVYHKINVYLMERKIYLRFKQGLETYNL